MKTKALISFAITAKLICGYVFAYAIIQFSHDLAQIISYHLHDMAPNNKGTDTTSQMISIFVMQHTFKQGFPCDKDQITNEP